MRAISRRQKKTKQKEDMEVTVIIINLFQQGDISARCEQWLYWLYLTIAMMIDL